MAGKGDHGHARDGGRPLTSRDLLRMRFVGDPRISPDGSLVAWVEQWIDAGRNAYRSNIFVAPADGSARSRPFTTGPGRDRSPRWSPDGQWLAFLSDRPLPSALETGESGADPGGGAGGEAGEPDQDRPAQLYVMPASGGEARPLTRLQKGAAEPVWSPDGRRVAVLVAAHPERGLEPLGAADPDEKDLYRKYNRDVRVITRLRYKLDGAGFFDERRKHVAIVELDPGGTAGGGGGAAGAAWGEAEVRQWTRGPYDIRTVAWMPDGQHLVVVTNPDPEADRQPWTDVYLVPCDGPPGQPWDLTQAGSAGSGGAAAGVRKITHSDIDIFEALPSPDGRWIACRGQDARRYRAYGNTHLYLFSVDGKERRCLTAEADLTVGDESINDIVGEAGAVMAWAPDGSGIYALVSWRGAVNLYWFGLDGTVRPLTRGLHVLRGFSLDRRGRRAAFVRLTETEPGDVWAAEIGPLVGGPPAGGPGRRTGSGQQVTSAALTWPGEGPGEGGEGGGDPASRAGAGAGVNGAAVSRAGSAGERPAGYVPVRLSAVNRRLLEEVQVVRPEHFTFQSDGHVLDGWLIRPVGFEPGKKYPAILQIHGGPMAMYGYAFFHEFQVLAARGYAVFYTNPRGSQGYGQDFCAAIRGDWGNCDYRDLMACVDAVLARFDYIDRQRLGVAGGSYGGYMTNWIVTHTDRFRAAVTMRCVANEHSFFGTSDIGYEDLFDLQAAPWEDP
ncbi:MAG TPA: S9 family peptidase, partial [Thermaerobacter sp.]